MCSTHLKAYWESTASHTPNLPLTMFIMMTRFKWYRNLMSFSRNSFRLNSCAKEPRNSFRLNSCAKVPRSMDVPSTLLFLLRQCSYSKGVTSTWLVTMFIYFFKGLGVYLRVLASIDIWSNGSHRIYWIGYYKIYFDSILIITATFIWLTSSIVYNNKVLSTLCQPLLGKKFISPILSHSLSICFGLATKSYIG